MEPQLAASITARVAESEFTRGVNQGISRGICYTVASLIAFFVISHFLLNEEREQQQTLQATYRR
jgi:hypothetical protein